MSNDRPDNRLDPRSGQPQNPPPPEPEGGQDPDAEVPHDDNAPDQGTDRPQVP